MGAVVEAEREKLPHERKDFKKRVVAQSHLPDGATLFPEYQELADSFATVCFFGSVCPSLGIWNFLHFFSEMKTDGWKLRSTVKRIYSPCYTARPDGNGNPVVLSTAFEEKSITADSFVLIFELVALVAIIVNTCLLCDRLGLEIPGIAGVARHQGGFSSKDSANVSSAADQVMSSKIFVYILALEHVLVFLKLYLSVYLPKLPESLAIMQTLDVHRQELQIQSQKMKKV